jgi:hypothetical protein
MFCPNCRTGYREGISECADCHVQLIDKQPPEPKAEYVDLVEVMTTSDPGQIGFVKSLFEGNGIKYVAQGEHFHALGRAPNLPVRFLVKKDQIIKAKALLKDL